MTQKQITLHLLPNAHLDPVWLWDWREGLNEGLVTVRTMLDLMDEFPELTFIRGESSIYEHIEQSDPKTFQRLTRMIDSGRWDVVGGTYVQPDSNLPATETLCRQFERGLSYFESRFGRRPTIGWQADSFGHTPGWPNILEAFGMEGFAFSRPQRTEFPMASPLFWWEGDHDNRLLCYRPHWMWYCSERFDLIKTMDLTVAKAAEHPFENVGLLMGLGNHGGGPSRRHIEEAARWAEEHPEVRLKFSTLHGMFDALRGELAEPVAKAVPRIRGDLGYCLRGCYSSVAKFKNPYRKAEALLSGAEATQAIVSATLGAKPMELDEAWDAILFNAFHDILPGTSIERAFDEQLASVGLATHRALGARFRALNQLAEELDTRVRAATKPDRATDVPVLVWNPLPRAVKQWFSFEMALDYRPIDPYPAVVGTLPLSVLGPEGKKVRFQEVAIDNTSVRDRALRKRVIVYDELPAFGWKLYQFGYREDGKLPDVTRGACTVAKKPRPKIATRDWQVEVTPGGEITIKRRGKSLFEGTRPLQVRLMEDPWGAWGGMAEEPESLRLQKIRETWKINRAEIIEPGPERAALWTRWQGKNSWLELTFHVAAKAPGVCVSGRLLMNERSARVKIVLPSRGRVRMEVPGSAAERNDPGHLPCGRWVSRGSGPGRLGFVSDVLSDVDSTADELRVTLARATRYADDERVAPDEAPWLAAVDSGEVKFAFWLTGGGTNLKNLAEELLHPPVPVLVPPHPGKRGRSGSLASLTPSQFKLLAAKTNPDGNLVLRVQNCGVTSSGFFFLGKKKHSLGELRAWEIATIVLPTHQRRR